jgi:hypothetical protein
MFAITGIQKKTLTQSYGPNTVRSMFVSLQKHSQLTKHCVKERKKEKKNKQINKQTNKGGRRANIHGSLITYLCHKPLYFSDIKTETADCDGYVQGQ